MLAKAIIPVLKDFKQQINNKMIKGINALVDAKRASSFNNAIKLINENVQITHDRLITLENRTAMMAKAIIPVLKDFKQQINNTNDRLYRQYRMMTKAHDMQSAFFLIMQTALYWFSPLAMQVATCICCPKGALVLGNVCERLCTSRPLLGSYVHQESM